MASLLKTPLLLILLSVSISAFAQTSLPVDKETGKVSFSEVVEVPGMTKEQLQARATEWLAKSYKSANDVIQMNDKEAGKIIAKGNTRCYVRSVGKDWDIGAFSHTLTLSFKEGKYRFEFTNFVHESSGTSAVSNGPIEGEKGAGAMTAPTTKQWNSIKQDLDKKMKEIVESLKKAMTSTKDSEW